MSGRWPMSCPWVRANLHLHTQTRIITIRVNDASIQVDAMKLFLWIVLAVAMVPFTVHASESLQQLQQLVDYVGADYQGAVSGGKVVNASEYEEMRDFADTLVDLSAKFPHRAGNEIIRGKLATLRELVRNKADPVQVAGEAGEVRQLLIQVHGLAVVPAKLPNLQRGRALYAEQCAACHGVAGRGDGPVAATLDPPPTDFTDMERYRARTLYGLYSTITRGVPGTAMQGYASLPERDRWSLAFYVGQLAPAALHGGTLPGVQGVQAGEIGARGLTTLTPAEVESRFGSDGARTMAWLRGHPEAVLGSTAASSGLAFAARKLQESLAAYQAGDSAVAHELAVSAYLEGFELLEGNLDAADSALRHRIESAMTTYRVLIKKGASGEALEQQLARLQALLQAAGNKLDGSGLAPATAFTGALVILLREGLEAILVVAALAAFLIKTGRRDGLRYLYLGTGAAFGLGLLTWFVSSHVITIGGAQREVTEGLAALFAAAMLFYVGFWLHSKTGAAQWKAFIQGSIEKALGRGALWGLSGLAFIAVYREIFETVLFYQALWVQAGEGGQGMIFTGFLVAAVLLLAVGWMILRYSARLPLRQFFSVTSVFMFLLAVVFAGKGIAALQEAGKLPVNMVDLPTIEILGIYPNLEGLAVQLLLAVMALLLLWKGSRGTPPGDAAGGSRA